LVFHGTLFAALIVIHSLCHNSSDPYRSILNLITIAPKTTPTFTTTANRLYYPQQNNQKRQKLSKPPNVN
jgi:hypothetical protein